MLLQEFLLQIASASAVYFKYTPLRLSRLLFFTRQSAKCAKRHIVFFFISVLLSVRHVLYLNEDTHSQTDLTFC